MKTLGFVHMVFWHYLFLCVTVSYESSFHTTAKSAQILLELSANNLGFFPASLAGAKIEIFFLGIFLFLSQLQALQILRAVTSFFKLNETQLQPSCD